MSDLLLDIVDYIASKGIVEGDGIDSFRDTAPNEPDDLMAVYEYAGSPTPLNEGAVHRSLQIVYRSKSPSTARDKARAIFSVMSPLDRVLRLHNGRFCQAYPRQGPFKMKQDDNGRVYYGFNIGITSQRD